MIGSMLMIHQSRDVNGMMNKLVLSMTMMAG
jgi:hypothetical protein